ncbi:MAG: DUF2974 domain-containing protein [Clostridiales bacterium]|nr:DUF2974 domain-containing protein [Clostridiales bacterium]
MPTILDHAELVGNVSLTRRPFDALDSLILTQIVYMPMEGWMDHGERCTIAQAWTGLRKHCDYETLDVFQKKRYRLTEACAGLSRYAQWIVGDYVNQIDAQREMQFCAATFDLLNGTSHISFRGTDLTIAGWKEDLNLSFMIVPAQLEAVRYVERAAMSGHQLMLGGHSKGGNLAVYASATVSVDVQEQIAQVYSFDGPGLDEETLGSDGYHRVTDRIESYIPQSSVVGMLLYYHPVYTVVRASALGILQHDAMTWQIEDGKFDTLDDLDMSGKITDEALHAWLGGIKMDERKLLVDTLYDVVGAAQSELVTDLVEDWLDSASKMLEAIRGIDPEVKRKVRKMIRSLFSTGASEVVRMILPGIAEIGRTEKTVPADDE